MDIPLEKDSLEWHPAHSEGEGRKLCSRCGISFTGRCGQCGSENGYDVPTPQECPDCRDKPMGWSDYINCKHPSHKGLCNECFDGYHEKCTGCECHADHTPQEPCNHPERPMTEGEAEIATGLNAFMDAQKPSNESWEVVKAHILGEFNAGQYDLLTQNGSVTLTADQQRKEGTYNCRDARIAIEKAEAYFLAALTRKEADTIQKAVEARESLAEIEHDQWIAWSRDIAATDKITPARIARWSKLWRPYAELTEAEKDQDREWADKVLAALRSLNQEEV